MHFVKKSFLTAFAIFSPPLPPRFAYGPTMEWGFLFSIMGNPEIASLVDELYIELHFHFPSLFWKHYHSNWEALDAIRHLRAQGAIVHSWP